MSKSNLWEADVLALLFTNTNAANIGDATGLRGSSTAGSLYISLHTADPGEGGNQTTNEADYTSYARVPVARTSGGWTVSGTAPTQVQNAATVTFPQCTGGNNTITYFGVGTDSTGAGNLLYSGVLSSSLSVSNLIQPLFQAGNLTITED